MKVKPFLFAVIIGFLFCLRVFAGDLENRTSELANLRDKINKATRVINELKTDKKSLRAELRALEIKYGKSASHLVLLEQKINKLKVAIEENAQQQQEKLQKIKSQKERLENQVKAAYGMGRHERLKLMLNQQAPALSGRIMVYYDYLNTARLKQISDIDQDLQALHDLELQHFDESELLNQKLEQRKQSQLILKQAKIERKSVLAKISKQSKSKKQQLKKFKRNENKLTSLIRLLQKTRDDSLLNKGSVKEFTKQKGHLPWPVKGKLIKKFGDKRSGSRWDGVLIQAKEGREVRAVAKGQVVYADWLRGYGLLTIIKHDKGYMTLYAFNQSLYKSIGDKVKAGTVISTVGLSDGRKSAGLYFGIRKKDKPVNPVKWCKKVRQGNVG